MKHRLIKKIILTSAIAICSLAFTAFADDGNLIVHSGRVEGAALSLILTDEKSGKEIEVPLDESGRTEADISYGTYRLHPSPKIDYSEAYSDFDDTGIQFLLQLSGGGPLNGTFTLSPGSPTYELGSQEHPIETWFLFEGNKDYIGTIKEKLISIELLMYDPRLEKFETAEEQVKKSADHKNLSDDYRQEMSGYIRELSERNNFEINDDSKINSYGGYGEDPFGINKYDKDRRDPASPNYRQIDPRMYAGMEESESPEETHVEKRMDKKLLFTLLAIAIIDAMIIGFLLLKHKKSENKDIIRIITYVCVFFIIAIIITVSVLLIIN